MFAFFLIKYSLWNIFLATAKAPGFCESADS